MADLLRLLADELEVLVEPVRSAATDTRARQLLLEQLGWTPGLLDDDGLGGLLAAVQGASELLGAVVPILREPPETPAEWIETAGTVGVAVTELNTIALSAEGLGLPSGSDVENLGEDLAAVLAVHWLQARHPFLWEVLSLFDLVEVSGRDSVRRPGVVGRDGSVLRLAYSPPSFHMARLPDVIAHPVRHLAEIRDVRGHEHLLRRAARVLRALGMEVVVGYDPRWGYELDEAAAADAGRMLHAWRGFPMGEVRGSLGFVLALPDPATEGLDLFLAPKGGASFDVSFGRWTLGTDISVGMDGFGLGPDGLVLPDSVEPASTHFGVSLSSGGADWGPVLVIGAKTGTRLELRSLAASVWFDTDGRDVDYGFSVSLPDLALFVGAGEGDSFLAGAMPSEDVRVDAALEILWSREGGLRLGGEAGLEETIDLNVSVLNVVRLLTLSITARCSGEDGIGVSAGLGAALELGPFTAVVDGIGLDAGLTFPEGGGNIGPADLALGFRPPTGIGMAIDSPAASGGGYLYLDAEKGEYAGVLDLEMAKVGVTAIGMLVTKLPGGVPGWSLFFSLSATMTGVQLGFGFTLNGVGGLIGINRGVDEDALADGVRTGALDAILFPEDPVGDAPRILSELDAVFPVAVGQYVFGPVAKLGWGTPTLIEADLGVVLQLPEPLTISLLGSLSAVLPSEEAAVLELHVDVAGTLNLTEGTLKIDAALRDSRVLTLELTGDMAIRASFLDAPGFLVSFGGFHPAFLPPADFPTLRRLGVALDTGDALRIQLGGYFALTSNTVQFGAEFSIYAKAAGFTAEGGSSFDALITLTPFGFVVGMKVWVSIRAGSVELLGVLLVGELSGPNRWHAVGEATFSILGVKKSLEVEATFGKKKSEPPQKVLDVGALLLAELRLDSAWSTVAGKGDGDAGVVCREGSSGVLEVHPAGRIEVRQRLVPLETRIDHYGNARVEGANLFAVTGARLGAESLEEGRESVEDWFAAAQYFELDEDEKLSAPSFDKMPAGVRLGDDTVSAGSAVELTCDHEVVYRDPAVRPEEREDPGTRYVGRADALERALSEKGAAARKASGLGTGKTVARRGTFGVSSPSFVTLDGVTGLASDRAPDASFYACRDRALTDEDATGRIVVPAYELESIA